MLAAENARLPEGRADTPTLSEANVSSAYHPNVLMGHCVSPLFISISYNVMQQRPNETFLTRQDLM